MPNKIRIQAICRYNQLTNKIFYYIYSNYEHEDISVYLSTRDYEEYSRLSNSFYARLNFDDRNVKRMRKRIRLLQRRAMENYIEDEIYDYTHVLSESEREEYNRLDRLIYT